MPIWQLCANLLIPNCLRSNLSYSPLAALEFYVKLVKTLGYRQKTLPVSVLIYYARLKQGEFFIRMKQMLSFFRKPLCYLMYLLLFAELFVEFYYSFYSFTENVEREVLIG